MDFQINGARTSAISKVGVREVGEKPETNSNYLGFCAPVKGKSPAGVSHFSKGGK